MSLVQKLRKIEKSIEEKNFSHGLEIVRQLIKDSPEKVQKNSINCKIKVNKFEEISFGALIIEKRTGKVVLNKQVVDLSTNEFTILVMLVENPDKILSRDKLHKALLKTEYDGLNRSIDNTISRLRKKLDDQYICQLKIKSIRGKGYLFSTEDW